MSNETNTLRGFISASLAENSGIWQMQLLTEKELSNLARDKGLSYWADEDVKRMWQVGLLRADLIASDSEINLDEIVLLKQDDYGQYFYQDRREFAGESGNLDDILKNLPVFPPGVRLLFHPYRYFVLYQIEEEFKLNVSKLLVLNNPGVVQSKIEKRIETIRTQAGANEFRETFEKINRNVDIIVGCEPFTFRQLFGFYKFRIVDYKNAAADDDLYFNEVESYQVQYTEIVRVIGLDEIKAIHSDICRKSQSLEPNIKIHRLLRFTTKDFRLKEVKGRLGGALYLLAMAESLRRAAERVFETELPEEDEIGFSYGVGTNKKYRYGEQRMIDNALARREFVRDYGLDYTVRLRWYVEGYTEFGALNLILGNHLNIELINLKGLIVAAGNKGLAFKENLLNDLKSAVYSWVTIDKDDQNCINILLNAVRAEEMFGMFFLSDPDFEFHNFTAGELAEIVWDWAQELGGVAPEQKEKLIELTAHTKTGSEFFKAVNQAIPYQPDIKKGVIWGEKLSKYAHDFPDRADTNQVRPLIRAIMSARHSYNTSYHLGTLEGKVDVETGNIVYPKNLPLTDAKDDSKKS